MAESHTPKDDVQVIQKESEDDVIPEGNVAPEDDAEPEGNVHQEEDDILVPVGDIALLATGGNDNIIKMWDVQTGESYRSFSFLDSVSFEISQKLVFLIFFPEYFGF